MAKSFDELALFSVPDLVRSDPESKTHFLRLGEAAAMGLTEFGLAKSDLAARYHAGPEAFEILLGDLTEHGLAFAKSGFQRWLSNSDRWKSESSLAKYSGALAKQWEKSGGSAV